MGKINSKKKGSRGELELVHFLRECGFDARRGQQFKGTPDSPDVVSDKLSRVGLHIECKRVEAGNLYNWLDQAKADAGEKTPVVMHRRNNRDWVAILDLDSFLRFINTALYKQDLTSIINNLQSGKENGTEITD